MSAAPGMVRAVTAPVAPVRPSAAPTRVGVPSLGRRFALRVGNRWMQRAAWTVNRTGRTGLIGIALLLAASLFYLSTHLKVAAEIESLRADLADAQGRARTVSVEKVADPLAAMPALPGPTDMPAILRQLFSEATRARLAVDTGKYEFKETKSGGLVRYHVTFPVKGPYPQIRSFIDTTLSAMPAVALSDLELERKSIADGEVEAQIRMTIYAAEPGARGLSKVKAAGAEPERATSGPGAEVRPWSDRVVAPTHAGALFAQHSWTVLPKMVVLPPPPPVEAPPPPPPAAPPLPYSFLGSYAPAGGPPVFFLAHGDRMFDAHIGDQLEGVYQLESAANSQLVFVYLPLNIRQNLSAGATK